MSEFLTARGDLNEEIETSQKALTDLRTKHEDFAKAINWLLNEKSCLERTAAKIDVLKKEAISEQDKIELGKIEAELDATMTLLSGAMKNARIRSTQQSDTTSLKNAMTKSMWCARRTLDKITCDIVDYKYLNSYEFVTVTYESTKEAPLVIKLTSYPKKNHETENHHIIFDVKQGKKNIGFYGEDVLSINGYGLAELNRH